MFRQNLLQSFLINGYEVLQGLLYIVIRGATSKIELNHFAVKIQPVDGLTVFILHGFTVTKFHSYECLSTSLGFKMVSIRNKEVNIFALFGMPNVLTCYIEMRWNPWFKRFIKVKLTRTKHVSVIFLSKCLTCVKYFCFISMSL